MLGTLILICIIVIASLVMYAGYTIHSFSPAPVDTTYADIRSTLETGDIILFSCHWHSSTFNKIFYMLRTKMVGTEYGHVGIVYKTDDGRLFLYEGVATGHVGGDKGYYLNNMGLGGIRLIELDTIMHEYHNGGGGGASFAVIPCAQPLSNRDLEAHISVYNHRIFESFAMISTLACLDIFVGHNSALSYLKRAERLDQDRLKRITCSEFVFDLLYQCGRIEPYNAKLFWPSRFVDGTFHRLSKIPYGSPIKYVYTGI